MSPILKKLLAPILYSKSPPLWQDILEWALHRDWEVLKIHEPYILNVPIPRGEIPLLKFNRYAMNHSMGYPGQYLICIPGGISHGAGFVQDAKGHFFTESAWRIESLLQSNIYKARFRRNKLSLKGDYFNIRAFWGSSYGHWLYEEVPRLFNALPHLPKNTRFLVPDPLEKWKLESLLALGIGRNRLMPVKHYYAVHCERLWYATELGSMVTNGSSPDVCSQVRDIYRNYAASVSLDATQDEGATKIFISRANVAKNRIVNEEDLLSCLNELGFSIVSPEKYSFTEQAKMFRSAQVVIGSFGAALTNIIYAPPGAILVDLQDYSRACPRMWFWKLANVFGYRYKTIIGDLVEDSGWERISFKLDVDFFAASLREICKSFSAPSIDKVDWFQKPQL